MANCVVSNVGQVVCVPPTHQTSLCVGDLTRYPFDTQNCTIRFGSWVHSGEEIDIQLAKPPVSTGDLVPNGEWTLVDKQAVKHAGKFKCCPNSTYPSVFYIFQIKRMVGAHVASVILPAIALVAITLTSLWMSPSHSDRLSLCCVNLVCEFLYAQYVSYMLPSHGQNIPLILLFARDSLLLSAFTIVLTVVLKNMVENEKPAPGWMSGTVYILTSSRPGQFIFLNDSSAKGVASAQGEDDGTTIIGNSENVNPATKEWIVFAKILDRLCFVIYFIMYLVMFVSFTP
ncbi:nicotinic acetylcholine receptor alpha 9 subunit, partial [Asbolus verrucosus]